MSGADLDAVVPATVPATDAGGIGPTVPDAVGATGARPKRAPGQEAGLAVGQLLGQRYKIEQLLGAGGMGAVYRATDEKLHRSVAVKVMRPELAAETQLAARFEREAFASTRITSPHVVVVHDFGRDDQLLFLVMELLSGMSLGERMERGTLDPEEALRILVHVARALEQAHAAGIVHRDLKPDNIFLTDAGPAKVLDFGIARMLDGGPKGASGPLLTVAGMIVGTPLYMSPEMARQQPVGPAADLYAVGAILYEMLTGQTPFLGNETILLMAKHMTEEPPRLAAHAACAQHEGPMLNALDAIVARLLEKDPAVRGTTAELRVELEELSGGATGWGMEKRPSGNAGPRTPRPDVDVVGPTLPHVDSNATPILAPVAQPRRGLLPRVAIVGVVFVIMAVVGWQLSTANMVSSSTTTAPTIALPQVVPPPTSMPTAAAAPELATIHFTLEPAEARVVSSEGTMEGADLRLPRDGATHVVQIEAEGYETESVTITASGDRDVQVALRPSHHGHAPHPATTVAPEAPATGTGLQRQF